MCFWQFRYFSTLSLFLGMQNTTLAPTLIFAFGICKKCPFFLPKSFCKACIFGLSAPGTVCSDDLLHKYTQLWHRFLNVHGYYTTWHEESSCLRKQCLVHCVVTKSITRRFHSSLTQHLPKPNSFSIYRNRRHAESKMYFSLLQKDKKNPKIWRRWNHSKYCPYNVNLITQKAN